MTTETGFRIDNAVILDGEGNLIVDASGQYRVFSVGRTKLKLLGVTVTYSGPEYGGGGISNSFGTLTLINSTVSRTAMNTIGIGNSGTLTLINSTVSGSGGDGISSGGGGTLTLINSTVSGNSGDGISNTGTLTLINSTVSGNSGNGIYNRGGTLTLINSVIDGDCTGGVTASNGYNIESPGDTCGFDPDGTDLVNVTAEELNLGPLADNGGPTETHALLPGSIAIDRIPPEDCVDADGQRLTSDQRGFYRDSMCDVGAYELGAQEAQPSGGGGGCSLVHREDAPGIWLLAVLALLGIRLASRRKAKRV